MSRTTAPVAASRPPALPGLDPAWSRLVTADDADGVPRTWHVLDNGAEPRVGTMVCVHGNPTWSYLWRRFLDEAPDGWRVIAVDQLGMGYSDRTAEPRTFAQRVDDVGVVTDALGVSGPVVSVGHDWGGPISLGWALAHRPQLRAVVLANTGVHQPADSAAPTLIRLARTPLLRGAVCTTTPIFVRATSALSRPPLDDGVRDALAAPYRSAARRRAVGDFVADIPLEPGHRSTPTLDGVKAGLADLGDVPVLALWGPRDPVFSDRYLRDLLGRVPHAQVHRYETASHLVTEDAPQTARHAWEWIAGFTGGAHAQAPAPPLPARPPLWAALDERAGDPSPAVVELAGRKRTVSFALLARRVREIAAGLAAEGVRPGDRVALLVPAGADLTAAVYACWRAGAVIVVADPGLGPLGLARALRGAGPDHVIGAARGLALARGLGIPGRRIAAGALSPVTRRLLGVTHDLAGLARAGRGQDPPAEPSPDAECAVLFTSGSTGPAKGVVYRHRQAGAQVAALREAFGITGDDRLVAAFPPFALYGPALGIASAVPDAPVPGQLSAAALAEAAAAVEATVVFASPAALRTVVTTAGGAVTDRHRAALDRVRLVVSAGAPVPAALLHELSAVVPHAELHTPYGMTEALPVTDITLAGIDAAGPGDGVCVGLPLTGVEVRVSPLTDAGDATGPLTEIPGVTGELCIRAEHVKERYDRLWATERDSSRNPGWHRSGDVAHLDALGRVWIEGRLGHVISTPEGPVSPVGIEQRVQVVTGGLATAVGVGPAGAQLVVVVLSPDSPPERSGLAPASLATSVRQAADHRVSAVLTTDRLPLDVRHAAKIDRTRVARWAELVLAGGSAGRRP
ncbi:acyl-CoA synthetase (AMP-forming)/AMP-acid ligase II [Pseudonocardia sediminis]|uniref:Acyl-CoA synthetase (AMP-forming)/AMP-acid ligase II n=1 Tax=Pseudonocardia sediminis TaxID=1397368 RepID=A0A4Q7UXZ7_PSEST|nr:alpha/beta fold hydrolase [Pseudonocardia sediminis]RZT86922.1 acyl-CoA synthetase (AMP-forming)/AMP-acid ligase II [Pseudonocardia sediminis]